MINNVRVYYVNESRFNSLPVDLQLSLCDLFVIYPDNYVLPTTQNQQAVSSNQNGGNTQQQSGTTQGGSYK